MRKLFVICPGMGAPEAANKERILRHNLDTLQSSDASTHVRVCCYTPGYQLPPDLAQRVEVICEPGIIGQFLLKYAHPEEIEALGCTHVAILMDDVELLPSVHLHTMIRLMDATGIEIASPVLSEDSLWSWGYTKHRSDLPERSITQSNFCEMFFMVMRLEHYKRYYLGLDMRNPWCWGVDTTINTLRGLSAMFVNDMQMKHWCKGSGSKHPHPLHHAPTDEMTYLRRRGLDVASVRTNLKLKIMQYTLEKRLQKEPV